MKTQLFWIILLIGATVLSVPLILLSQKDAQSPQSKALDLLKGVVISSGEISQRKTEEAARRRDLIQMGDTEALKDQLKELWKAFDHQRVKEVFKKQYSYQHAGDIASVRGSLPLSQTGKLDPIGTNEGRFLTQRLAKIRECFRKNPMLGYNLTEKELPRIGIALGGGGYRSLIFSSGFLRGLEESSILCLTSYLVTLSGSSWFVGPWIQKQFMKTENVTSIAQEQEGLLAKIQRNTFNLFNISGSINLLQFTQDALWPKIVFDQMVTTVDFWGGILARVFLSEFGNKQQQQRLSHQWDKVREGEFPWPIYTAISMHKLANEYLYNWYEFNPEEVRNLEINAAIPLYAFGRTFEAGKSTDSAPEQSLGFLLGIFGSAYTPNIADIRRIYLLGGEKPLTENVLDEAIEAGKKGNLNKLSSLLENKFSFNKLLDALFVRLLNKVTNANDNFKSQYLRLDPAQVRNPFKGYEELNQEWLEKRDQLTFIDAGIDYNLPLRPLFRPERRLDLIIVGDASSNVMDGPIELIKGLEDIKRVYQVSYRMDEELTDKGTNKTFMVLRPDQTHFPILVYLNFLKDPQLMQQAKNNAVLQDLIKVHDLEKFNLNCLQNYCSTYNFTYSQSDFNMLSGIARFNVVAHEDKILQIIEEIVDRKSPSNKSSFGS